MILNTAKGMAMQDNLKGQVALVTGASRGIGRAVAIALAEAGAAVAVNYRSREQAAKETCAEITMRGRNAVAVAADVSVADEVARMVTTVEEQLGSVAILVNNAGVTRPQSLDTITEQDWDEILRVNLKSMFLVTQAILPRMRAEQVGTDHQPLVGGGSTGRRCRSSLRRVQGRYHRLDSLVCAPACQGRDHGQRDCPGVGGDRDGHQ